MMIVRHWTYSSRFLDISRTLEKEFNVCTYFLSVEQQQLVPTVEKQVPVTFEGRGSEIKSKTKNFQGFQESVFRHNGVRVNLSFWPSLYKGIGFACNISSFTASICNLKSICSLEKQDLLHYGTSQFFGRQDRKFSWGESSQVMCFRKLYFIALQTSHVWMTVTLWKVVKISICYLVWEFVLRT